MTDGLPRVAGTAEDVALIEAVASDLIECRQRGIDLIDVDTAKQPRKRLDALEDLAKTYCERHASSAVGRVAQINTLLRAGIEAYGEHGQPRRAAFLHTALFDPPDVLAPLTAGQRLDRAMAEYSATRQPDEPAGFNELRQPLFRDFAAFLMSFATHQARSRTRWLLPAAGVVVVLALAGGGAAIYLCKDETSKTVGAASTAPSGTPAARTTSAGAAAIASGETSTQIAFNRNGVPVFDDPRTPSRTMPKIPFTQEVEVSCRYYSPSMASVEWWYRLADEPYNNEWWAPAVNFLNGDPPDGPYLNDVDLGVPVCDGV